MAEWHAAYVLLRIGTADAANIRQRLVKLPGVNLAHTLLGPDDLICYIEAEGIRGYNKVLNAEIRPFIDEGTASSQLRRAAAPSCAKAESVTNA